MLRKATRGAVEMRESDWCVKFQHGAEVWIKSSEKEHSLRGAGLAGVGFDECRDIKPHVWREIVRPALIDSGGFAMFASTPRGHDWFWQLEVEARGREDWACFHYSTRDNPSLSAQEIAEASRDLTERQVLQEIDAEYLGDGSGVFRGVDKVCVGIESQPETGHQYVIGVDWGRSGDYTVYSVVDATTRRQVRLDRFSGIEYPIQADRLAALAQKYNHADIVAESNAMGQPIIEMLGRRGLYIMPFHTSAASKAKLVDRLALEMERADIVLLNHPALRAELTAFEATRLPSGQIRYSAPAEMHDDTVIATMLSVHGAATDTITSDSVAQFERAMVW
jgi:hypothetical protein